MHINTTQQHRYIGFDSEFLPTGAAGDPASVHAVQFSDGCSEHVFIESAEELKRYLHNHADTLKEIFGFSFLCDLGSLKEWLPANSVEVKPSRGKLVGYIRYGKAHIRAYDLKPLCNNFGLVRLEQVGKVVGVPKFDRPEFLGKRKWESPEEHEAFRQYAIQDAIVTARGARWLIEDNQCDPREIASAGGLAAQFFEFPKRHQRLKGRILIPPVERTISQCGAAGRNEMFTTGFTRNVYYSDVKSLYPMSIFATQALKISGVQPCEVDDIRLSDDLNETRFGWVVGAFETKNKMWGLPIRAQQVTYVIGKVTGMFSTYDLAAAHAKVLWISKCYKPTYDQNRWKAQSKFDDMLLKRVEGKLDKREARFSKAVLNCTYGKLNQSHPESTTTNYPAAQAILSHSHLIMSKLFDKCPQPILGMDTDSIFSTFDMTGKYEELSNGQFSIPIIVENKGYGDLASFRAKTYMVKQEGKKVEVFGRHAWHCLEEDYFRLWNNPTFPFTTRIDVKHTPKTRNRAALRLPLGYWDEKPVELTRAKVCALLQADMKRARLCYDSFSLFEQRKSQSSEPWVMDDILLNPNFEYPPKSSEKFPHLINNKFLTQDQREIERKIRNLGCG